MKYIRQTPRRKHRGEDNLAEIAENSMPEAFSALDTEFLALAKRDSLDDGSTALVRTLTYAPMQPCTHATVHHSTIHPHSCTTAHIPLHPPDRALPKLALRPPHPSLPPTIR